MSLTIIAILCGVLAVVYGIVTSRQVLSASAGNDKMQEIAAAIQEGAKAYLGRQYRTIAIVGVAVAVLVAGARSSSLRSLKGKVVFFNIALFSFKELQ
jgi:K(+)-stimulated pyrophosphate-energized sodium pump